jgi:hypothetical protein
VQSSPRSRLTRWVVCAAAAAVVTAVLPPAPAAASLIVGNFVHLESGEGVAPGSADQFNDVSIDGGTTWTDAMVVSAVAGWDTIADTDWISVDSTRGDPARANTTTLFRRLVSFPPGLVDATSVQLCVHADNAVKVTWNGTTIIDQTNPTDTANFSDPPSCASLASVMRSGLNTILFAVENGAGAMGLDFSVDGVWIQDVDAPPLLRLPANATVAATSPSGASFSYGDVFATDITGQTLTATCTPPSGSLFAVGETTVTCSATGSNNQTATGTFTVLVTPFVSTNLPPALSLPNGITVHTTSLGGKRVSYSATAMDDSGIPPTVVCVPPSGSLFPVGTTTVTCTATDNQNQTSTGAFMVTVIGPLQTACSLLQQSLSITLKSKLVTTLKAAGDALYQARRWADSTTIRNLATKVKNSHYAVIKPALRQTVVYTVRNVMDRACTE